MGPTGTGKSSAAIELARQYPIEIINCDSMQVYRGLDIGTAKVPQSIRDEIPHHLIDIRDPDQPYSAANFSDDARACVEAIHQRNNIPLLVGGTGLYFRFFENGYRGLPGLNQRLRDELEQLREKNGNKYLWEYLNQIDPLSASKVDANDPIRVIRSIEIFQFQKTSRADYYQKQKLQDSYQIHKCILTISDRAKLRHKNGQRCLDMLASGWIDEVRSCHAIQSDRQLPAAKAVGYRQILQYLDEGFGMNKLEDLIMNATNQYMKRQITWFARETGALFIDCMSEDVVGNISKHWEF